jgi:hypothetical protein
MEKQTWYITHSPMKHGWTASEWQGDTQEEAIKGFLRWVDIRGEFVEVLSIDRGKSLQEQMDAVFADGQMNTIGD